MSYQDSLTELTTEVKTLLQAAGYNPQSLILKFKFDPFDGWQFECLANKAGRPVRERLVLAGEVTTADELLRALRDVLGVPQLQLI